ncbi:MAG: short-chain dehydrogenase/reductase, partial [Pseudomonadota bacterium]
YNATKFAVEGLSEALWQEVEPLGIKVMLVEPSGFRSYGAGRSANESRRKIDDYAAMAGAWSRQVPATSGRQPGDTVRAAYLIVKATESLNPPHRLLLVNDAYDAATKKLEELCKEFSSFESVSRMADFPMDMQGRAA